jgi:hypothetical protein
MSAESFTTYEEIKAESDRRRHEKMNQQIEGKSKAELQQMLEHLRSQLPVIEGRKERIFSLRPGDTPIDQVAAITENRMKIETELATTQQMIKLINERLTTEAKVVPADIGSKKAA